MRAQELLPALLGAMGIIALAVMGLPSTIPHTLAEWGSTVFGWVGAGIDATLWH